MPLVATLGGTPSNSYLTEADATALMDERIDADVWTAASVPTRERALIMATRLLDNWFDWHGHITYWDQILMWPRYAVFTREGREWDRLTVPLPVLRATADLALELLKFDRMSEPDLLGLGISSARVGPISVTIDAKESLPYIPRYIIDFLQDFGEVKINEGGMRTLKVLRV